MRKYFFIIDKKGIEAWFPMDLEVGTEWYGGKVKNPGSCLFRAATNVHRGCYCLEADLDEETEKKLTDLLKDKKHRLKGKRLIEKYTGKNFKTEGITMDEIRKTKPYNDLIDNIMKLSEEFK